MKQDPLRVRANGWTDRVVNTLIYEWECLEQNGSIGDSTLRRVSTDHLAQTKNLTTEIGTVMHSVAFEAFRQRVVRNFKLSIS
jgi:hypothetical protein